MTRGRPVQTEGSAESAITDLRRELEGKGWAVIGIFVIILIAAFSFFSYQIGSINDKYEKMGERVAGLETEIKNLKELVHNSRRYNSN